MSNTFVPRPVQELLDVSGTVIPVWTAHAVAVGLTAGECTALTTARDETVSNQKGVFAVRSESKQATITLNDSADDLRTLMQRAVDKIRIFALASADPSAVFTLAQVPAPAAPTPLPPPEAPTNVTADPNADGTATISWKGSVAGGAFYTIWRKVGDGGSWTQIGAVAAKKFMDFNVPNPGTTDGATLFYGVRTQRNVEVSAMSVPATITYGSGPGFTAFGTEFSAQSGKLAA